MSLASIIAKIHEDGDAQAREILEQARLEGERIREHARASAKEEAEHILRHARGELETFKKKQMATTVLHQRKKKLDHRQQILQQVFEEVLRRALTHGDHDQRRDILKNMLLSIDEERAGTLIVSQADQALITSSLVEEVNQKLAARNRALRLSLSSETGAIERGFMVDFQDFDMNFSVETMFSDLWNEIKSDVSKQLFEENDIEESHGNH